MEGLGASRFRRGDNPDRSMRRRSRTALINVARHINAKAKSNVIAFRPRTNAAAYAMAA